MKLYLTKSFLLSLLLLFTACETLEISNNERILVKGKIIDENGNSLPNILLKTEALNSTLASANSEANGTFEFTSLNADNDPFYVLVNITTHTYFENENLEYSSKIYQSEGANKRLLLDLGTITLGGVGTFSIYLKNLSGDENSLEYTLSYTSRVCWLPLESNNNNECEFDQISNGLLGPTSENRTVNGESILGTVAIFEYSLNGTSPQTIEIPVTNPPTNYVFEY